MMRKLVFLPILLALVLISSCNNDTTIKPTFEFTFNWDGTPITAEDFNQKKFTNEFGDIVSISKMRFHISNITFHTSEGDSVKIKGYNFVDLKDNEGLIYKPDIDLKEGEYSNISFTFGFDSIDNSKPYIYLNGINWNWPEMLGAGYHFMQFEGKFTNNSGEEQGYALHLGKARVSPGVFEPNHFNVKMNGTSIEGDQTIEIKMNIAEWFKNPYKWNLDDYSLTLMPNYDAQKLINKNGRSVFSLGSVK